MSTFIGQFGLWSGPGRFAPDAIQTRARGGGAEEAVSLASRTLLGHGHLRLVGRFDSLRAFLPPPPPLFLSAELLVPVELLFFLPFFTTSHFPAEPLFEAISTFQNRVSLAARGFCDFLRYKETWPVLSLENCRGRCCIFFFFKHGSGIEEDRVRQQRRDVT